MDVCAIELLDTGKVSENIKKSTHINVSCSLDEGLNGEKFKKFEEFC